MLISRLRSRFQNDWLTTLCDFLFALLAAARDVLEAVAEGAKLNVACLDCDFARDDPLVDAPLVAGPLHEDKTHRSGRSE